MSAKKFIDKGLLDNRIFEALAQTSDRSYMFMCDRNTNVTRWSKSAVDYFGLPGEYIKDAEMIWGELIHPEDRKAYYKALDELAEGKLQNETIDHRIRNKNGEYVAVTCKVMMMSGSGFGEADIFIGTLENHGMTDRHDTCADMHNSHEFLQYVRELHSSGHTAVELLIGICNFSEINDIYGYAFGDKVIGQVAALLKKIMGERTEIYRMDGVTFACCLTDVAISYIYEIYRKLEYCMKYDVFVDGIRIPLNIAAGAVLLSGDLDEYSVQDSARYALEKSKNEHHGQLYVFEDDMKHTTKRRLELMSALRKSMLNDYEGFFMCYQPLISSDDEELLGAEALLRWESREFGMVMPGEFIPVLENDPNFFDLGNWILRRSLNESKVLVDRKPDFMLHVNVAYSQLSHPLFRESVKAILTETDFPVGNLCMELTESCRQLEHSYLLAEITYLRSLGIKIAIDDFGTGYSSLDLISVLPVETLKFDKGFTHDIMTNTANQAIIKAIAACAQELNVNVYLEGIETKAMVEFVKQFLIYAYQGYYYSKPIIMGQFLEMYLKH